MTVPAAERVLVTTVNREPRAMGRFTCAPRLVGSDDHSEDVLFATPLLANGVAVDGVLERNVDTDSFVTQQDRWAHLPRDVDHAEPCEAGGVRHAGKCARPRHRFRLAGVRQLSCEFALKTSQRDT